MLGMDPNCLLVCALQSSAVGPLQGSLILLWYLEHKSEAVEIVDMCLKVVPISLSFDVALDPRGLADPADLHGAHHADYSLYVLTLTVVLAHAQNSWVVDRVYGGLSRHYQLDRIPLMVDGVDCLTDLCCV